MKDKNNKKVLLIANHEFTIYNYRTELIERLLSEGYEVHISSPIGQHLKKLESHGVILHDIKIERRGTNPLAEVSIISAYKRLFKSLKPDVILGFTIKPNIYGSMVAGKYGIPFIANITGLGIAVENEGQQQKLFTTLYRHAFKNIQRVFFQNTDNQKFFADRNIAIGKGKLIPGSGVNLEGFPLKEYPKADNDVIRFVYISRLMKEKGIDNYLDTAAEIRKSYPNAEFHICGFCEKDYESKLEKLTASGNVIYHGMIENVGDFLNDMHCVVHPSYYPEGMSNVLLEAEASGRPVITTNRAGCRETVDDGVSGFIVPINDSSALIDAVKRFLSLTWQEKKSMGLAGRKKVEKEFDRQIVIKAYLDEIDIALKGSKNE